MFPCWNFECFYCPLSNHFNLKRYKSNGLQELITLHYRLYYDLVPLIDQTELKYCSDLMLVNHFDLQFDLS